MQFIKEQGLIPSNKAQLCFIGDGAGWIWDTAQSFSPDCRQKLDRFYCAQRLDYGKLRLGSYPLASVAIESAKKCICHVWLKSSASDGRLKMPIMPPNCAVSYEDHPTYPNK